MLPGSSPRVCAGFEIFSSLGKGCADTLLLRLMSSSMFDITERWFMRQRFTFSRFSTWSFIVRQQERRKKIFVSQGARCIFSYVSLNKFTADWNSDYKHIRMKPKVGMPLVWECKWSRINYFALVLLINCRQRESKWGMSEVRKIDELVELMTQPCLILHRPVSTLKGYIDENHSLHSDQKQS